MNNNNNPNIARAPNNGYYLILLFQKRIKRGAKWCRQRSSIKGSWSCKDFTHDIISNNISLVNIIFLVMSTLAEGNLNKEDITILLW